MKGWNDQRAEQWTDGRMDGQILIHKTLPATVGALINSFFFKKKKSLSEIVTKMSCFF